MRTSAIRAETLNPRLAIISLRKVGMAAPNVLFRRPRNFTFHPFHPQAATPATVALYPIFQRYKLILISARAHAGFLGRAKGGLDLLGFE